jgi:tetratricopeptide (TPR) repeat protein
MPFLFLKCLRGVSFLLLILSLPLHWFPVPVGLEERPVGVWKAVTAEPITTFWFKTVLIAMLVLVFTFLWRRRKRGAPINWSAPMISAGAFIAALVLLLFPAMTIQRCVSVTARATWLQMQHISLTWLGGDSFNAPEYADKPLEADIDVKNLPRAFTILPPPPLNLADFRLAKFTEILNWLGYTTAFCQLASAGWFCAAFGSILLVIGFIRKTEAADRPSRPPLGGSLLWCTILGLPVIGLLALGPVYLAGRALDKAREASANGRFAQALNCLDESEKWLPSLSYQTDSLYQRGWLDRQLGRQSAWARLGSAMREETEGFDDRAFRHYRELLDSRFPEAVQGEAFRDVLRLSLNDFNGGLVNRAQASFSQLVALDSTCLKALYALQLTSLKTGQGDQLARVVSQFSAIYKCFQSPEKEAILALAHRHLAELAFDGKDAAGLSREMHLAADPERP